MFIERGVNVAAQTKDGNTPLHLMSTAPYWTESQKRAEVARILLEHDGADVNAQNKYGSTPSRLASEGALCGSYRRPSACCLLRWPRQHGLNYILGGMNSRVHRHLTVKPLPNVVGTALRTVAYDLRPR
jgi:hypothetical protein